MKNWEIIADLAAIVMTAVLAVTSAQAAEPPPATIDCTFHHVELPKHGDYSKTKVAPHDMAWIAAEHPYPRPDEIRTGLVVWDKNYRQWGLVVLGKGSGHLTSRTDLPKLCVQLAKAASDHGANAIYYQLSNTQIRVQFLRIEDGYFRIAGRQQNPPREVLGNPR